MEASVSTLLAVASWPGDCGGGVCRGCEAENEGGGRGAARAGPRPFGTVVSCPPPASGLAGVAKGDCFG